MKVSSLEQALAGLGNELGSDRTLTREDIVHIRFPVVTGYNNTNQIKNSICSIKYDLLFVLFTLRMLYHCFERIYIYIYIIS